MLLLISMFSPLLHLPDLGLGAVVEVMDICTDKLTLLLMGRTAMSMALRNLNLMHALPKETKKLIRRNGPKSPRITARITNASNSPLTLTRHLRLLHLPLLPLLLTLIPTPTLPITRSSKLS
jgi:hypothetical protein